MRTQSEAHAELLRHPTFVSWSRQRESTFSVGRVFSYIGKIYKNHVANEKHYTIQEIAQQWGISTDLARDAFRDEPGVLRFERPGSRVKRSYSTLRVPESVMLRVHTRLTSR